MFVAVRYRTLSDAERRTGAPVTRGGSAPPRGAGERYRTVGGGTGSSGSSPRRRGQRSGHGAVGHPFDPLCRRSL